jgi:hypothetical protein
MILVSFFLSRRALFRNLSCNGVRLKVKKFVRTDTQTNKQTHTSHLILKDDILMKFFQKIWAKT